MIAKYSASEVRKFPPGPEWSSHRSGVGRSPHEERYQSSALSVIHLERRITHEPVSRRIRQAYQRLRLDRLGLIRSSIWLVHSSR